MEYYKIVSLSFPSKRGIVVSSEGKLEVFVESLGSDFSVQPISEEEAVKLRTEDENLRGNTEYDNKYD